MTTTPTVTRTDLDNRYKALIQLIRQCGGEAQARVSAHIRIVSGGGHVSIGTYHTSTIPIEERYSEYAVISSALGVRRDASGKASMGSPDWSKLKGQIGAGAKTAVVEVETVTEPAKDVASDLEHSLEVATEPERVNVPVTPPRHVEPTTEPPMPDKLMDMFAQALQGRMKVNGTADLDESRVKIIVDERLQGLDIPAQVKKANQNGSFPVDRVQKLIDEALANHVRQVVVVTPSGESTRLEGIHHRQFSTLLMACSARDNILLVGPTGSGKTTAAEQCAKALGLPFYFNGAIDTDYKLKGFIDAGGRLISPAFRKAYETGGVYLFDELDASLPPAVLSFNAALSNGYCDFPDKGVERHKDCIILAAGNTWLGGGTFDYVGRMKQDAAFADRFAMLHWDIDAEMEMAVCTNKKWCAFVQSARSNSVKHGLKVIISPRSTFKGERLLAVGLDNDTVIAMTVRKGMTDDQWNKINPATNN